MQHRPIGYQAKGKGHIEYLSKMANRIWEEENKHAIGWQICLFEAFRRHRKYLISLERYNRPIILNIGSGIWLPGADGTWV